MGFFPPCLQPTHPYPAVTSAPPSASIPAAHPDPTKGPDPPLRRRRLLPLAVSTDAPPIAREGEKQPPPSCPFPNSPRQMVSVMRAGQPCLPHTSASNPPPRPLAPHARIGRHRQPRKLLEVLCPLTTLGARPRWFVDPGVVLFVHADCIHARSPSASTPYADGWGDSIREKSNHACVSVLLLQRSKLRSPAATAYPFIPK